MKQVEELRAELATNRAAARFDLQKMQKERDDWRRVAGQRQKDLQNSYDSNRTYRETHFIRNGWAVVVVVVFAVLMYVAVTG